MRWRVWMAAAVGSGTLCAGRVDGAVPSVRCAEQRGASGATAVSVGRGDGEVVRQAVWSLLCGHFECYAGILSLGSAAGQV